MMPDHDTGYWLRKLRPLMRDQVRTWTRQLDVVDSDTRTLMERHIRRIAERRFEDASGVLSLPPAPLARGPIRLGRILYDKPRGLLGITPEEFLQNIAIVGRSGAGKTNAAFVLLRQLTKLNVPFLFLDWKRTGRHLIPLLRHPVRVYTPGRSLSPFPFNPFIVPPGIEPAVHAVQTIDVMADAYMLGEGAKSLLHRALRDAYVESSAPSVERLLELIRAVSDQERVRGWKISAVRALESLPDIGHRTSVESQMELAAELLRVNTIVELDGLSASGRKFLAPLLCAWVYAVRLSAATREKLEYVIFVEEAHHLLYSRPQAARESLLEMLMRQCREIGIAMVIIDQHPHLLSPAVLGNTFTTVSLNLKDPRDVKRAAELCQLEARDQRLPARLRLGEGIVRLQDRWHDPMLIEIPLCEVAKGAVTDRHIRRLMGDDSEHSGPKCDTLRELAAIRPIRPRVDGDLSGEALTLLHDVVAFPHSGVRQRYLRLGLSGDKGNRMKNELIAEGWLKGERIAIGTARKLLLKPTKKAASVFDAGVSPEGASHAYWKAWYSDHLRSRGWAVAEEAARTGGRADMIATRQHERIAVEIETGKSNVVSNVRNGLLARVDQVIVIATTPDVQATLERALAQVGLLIPGRVHLQGAGSLPKGI